MKRNIFSCIELKIFYCWPQGSDVTMLNKMNQENKGNKYYIASKSEYDTYFGIYHFAGVVYYDSTGTQTHCN